VDDFIDRIMVERLNAEPEGDEPRSSHSGMASMKKEEALYSFAARVVVDPILTWWKRPPARYLCIGPAAST
jgi:hypothetical protein